MSLSLSFIRSLFVTFLACSWTGINIRIASGSSSYTYCYNYTQCANETISTSYAACYGYAGCEKADIESAHTLAYGELGCYDATVDSRFTYAYGHYSLYAAEVETYHMYVYGYESSRIADISPYSTQLNIYFYGYYSGYGADVSCYSGDTCHLYCGSSYGCYGVDFYCYSGATCYYDCSGDDTCPTTYAGVESDLTYVTSIGTATISGEQSSQYTKIKEEKIKSDEVLIFSGLTDDEIREFQMGNRLAKDISLVKLEQDTKDDTEEQLRMTMEQEFWEEGQYLRKDTRDIYAHNDKLYPASFRNNKKSKKSQQLSSLRNFGKGGIIVGGAGDNSNKFQFNNNKLFGISFEEYGVALIVDILILAVVVQGYNFCTKTKAYQQV